VSQKTVDIGESVNMSELVQAASANTHARSKTTPEPRRINWVLTASMARSARSFGAAPESTAHDWAMASILHSWLCRDPIGVPSSKYARRYHPPSHA
jgi:hypothetical protein